MKGCFEVLCYPDRFVGEEWKKLPTEKRNQYEKLAEKDRDRYDMEMICYRENREATSKESMSTSPSLVSAKELSESGSVDDQPENGVGLYL